MKQSHPSQLFKCITVSLESVYNQIMNQVNQLRREDPQNYIIQLEGSNKELGIQLLQGKPQIVNLINKGALLFLIYDERPQLSVVIDSQQQMYYDLQSLKTTGLNYQANQLQKELQDVSLSDCEEHDLSLDFYDSSKPQEKIELKVDDCRELLRDRFEVTAIVETKFLKDILQKYFILKQLENQKKQLTGFGFYINNASEIIVEYRLNDRSLSLKQSTKRVKLDEVYRLVNQWFIKHQFEGFSQQLIKLLFNISQLHTSQEKFIMFNLVQACIKEDIYPFSNFPLRTEPENLGLYVIKPRNISTIKHFQKYKILIVRNHFTFYFLDHENLIMGPHIHQYTDLIMNYNYIVDAHLKKIRDFENLTQEEKQKIIQKCPVCWIDRVQTQDSGYIFCPSCKIYVCRQCKLKLGSEEQIMDHFGEYHNNG